MLAVGHSRQGRPLSRTPHPPSLLSFWVTENLLGSSEDYVGTGQVMHCH